MALGGVRLCHHQLHAEKEEIDVYIAISITLSYHTHLQYSRSSDHR